MAEDRMLSDEILLGIINSKSGGGGGGGTSNYNDLSNKPQIGGVTLSGNKTASDLGLVAAENGKGLSTNDYTDADKAIVSGVTAALAGKQDVLTAGKYIDIDANNEISVDPVIPNESFTYRITYVENFVFKVTKMVDGAVVFEQNYTSDDASTPIVFDNAIKFWSEYWNWYYELLVDSDSHSAGFKQKWGFGDRIDYTENFSAVDHSGEKLVVKSELDAAVDAIKDGQSIDSFADVETALATKADLTDLAPAFSTATAYTVGQYVSYDGNIYKCTSAHSAGAWVAGDFTLVAVGSELESKQDKTDNSLQTTDKTVVGAVNELKSGLTNVDVALSVPENSGKNVLPLTIDRLKKSNTTGTWAGNVYTVGYNTYTVSVDDNGVVTSIEGTSTNVDSSAIKLDFDLKAGSYILSSGFVELFGANDTFLQKDGVTIARGNNSSPGQNFTLSEDSELTWFFRVTNITKTSYPMIRPATITDPTFVPYIPSVESRIEAVESGDYKAIASVTGDGVKTVAQLLPDLFSSVPSYTKRCSLIYGKAVLPMAEKTTNNAKFGNVSNYQGTTYFLTVNIQPSTAYLTEASIASNGTITVTDRSTDVPTNGAVISLVQ